MNKSIPVTSFLSEAFETPKSHRSAGLFCRLVRLSLSLQSFSSRRLFCCLAGALLIAWAIPGLGQQLQSLPDGLVGEVVANELKAADAPGYQMYRIRKESSNGSTIREVIETSDWLIGRIVRKNGKPLTADEAQKEDERLTRLLTDSRALQKERVEQQANERRLRAAFKSLPQAFYYEYVDRRNNEDGSELVRLQFHPNPSFRPPTRELQVLTGMEGTMLVDVTAKRIVRVDARLVRRVNFAWGILAHLDPGGTFLLEQRSVGKGRWHITKIALRFTGKILLFRRLDIDSVWTANDFRSMPDALTLRGGWQLLKATGRDR